MAWTASVILWVLWVLGLVAGSTEGAWIHELFVASLAAFTAGLLSRAGRRGDAVRSAAPCSGSSFSASSSAPRRRSPTTRT